MSAPAPQAPAVAPGATPLTTPCSLLALRQWLAAVDVLAPEADQGALITTTTTTTTIRVA